MISLKGKVAFITGSAQGIGKAIALKLAEFGADIVIGDLNSDAIEETVKEIEAMGVNVFGDICDVTSTESVNSFLEKAKEKVGNIDILVNNAGITKDTFLMRMDEKTWEIVLKVNLTGAFNVTKAVIRDMARKKFGRIINISSVVGVMGNAGQANYAASKAGLIGFTKSVAKEYAKKSITVNAIAPGFIETKMTEKLSEDVKKEYYKGIPMQRFGKPEDVANAVVFLASDLSSYITGQVIKVDGGMVM